MVEHSSENSTDTSPVSAPLDTSPLLPVLANIFEGTATVLGQFPDQNIVVNFWAPWSHICPSINRMFHHSAALYPDVPHVFVNVDAHRELSDAYDVTSVPTVLVLLDREVVERLVGEVSPSVLDALVVLAATGS